MSTAKPLHSLLQAVALTTLSLFISSPHLTPMFIVCGVFYPTNVLPEFLQRFVQVLPLTHAVALTRPLIVGQPLTDVALHISVLLAYAVIGYYIAVILTRRRLVV